MAPLSQPFGTAQVSTPSLATALLLKSKWTKIPPLGFANSNPPNPAPAPPRQAGLRQQKGRLWPPRKGREMKRPEPVFETDYRHERRKHRHRCVVCNKILNTGDRVLMWRSRRGTRAFHVEHADRPIFEGKPETWRTNCTVWGLLGLRDRGWRVSDDEIWSANQAHLLWNEGEETGVPFVGEGRK